MEAGATADHEPSSLAEVHGSVSVPAANAGFLQQYRAFAGPALLISVGYMDPGNWGTDLQGGAQFKYGLMWVVLVASLMAIVLQVIAARLGVVTGKDLAQACRDAYPRWSRVPNWLMAEIAIAACDLAEVLGSAVALNLLFHIPLLWAVLITAGDVLLLLALQKLGIRLIEALVLVLVATIGGCFVLELFVLPRTIPNFHEIGSVLLTPGLRQAGMATVAIGIIGATVMPHNLYLHSALVQTRRLRPDEASRRTAIRWNTVDATLALGLAFFVNAAILVLAAVTFYGRSGVTVGGVAYAFERRDRLDPRRLPDAGAAPGQGGGQSALRCGTSRQRPVQHDHWHACRPGGHGRLRKPEALTGLEAAHHTPVRHRPGGCRHRPAWRRRGERSAGAEPGVAGVATPIRHVPATAPDE